MLGSGRDIDLYGQEAEAGLLAAFISRLEHRSVIDVGAERGAFAEAMLQARADNVHVIDSESENQQFLSERFGDEPRVTVHGPVGRHTRSLGSLVAEGELPKRVGVLKIAGKGNELGLLAGMGDLDCDIVLVERPRNSSRSNTDEIAVALRLGGFMHFALVGRQSGLPFVQWNDRNAPAGSTGLLIFVHARVLGRIVPLILEFGSRLVESPTSRGERDAALEHQQRKVIEDLRRTVHLQAAAADERLEAIEELLDAVKAVTRERDLQAKAAAERLAALHELKRDRDLQLAAAEKRLAVIEELERGCRSGGRWRT